jgi:hypothetical protein
MKKCILITGQWCTVCHAMESWFKSLSLPGWVFQIMDVESCPVQVNSVPVLLYMQGGETLDMIYGAQTWNQILHECKTLEALP